MVIKKLNVPAVNGNFSFQLKFTFFFFKKKNASVDPFPEGTVPPALTTCMLIPLIEKYFEQTGWRMVKVAKQHYLFANHGQPKGKRLGEVMSQYSGRWGRRCVRWRCLHQATTTCPMQCSDQLLKPWLAKHGWEREALVQYFSSTGMCWRCWTVSLEITLGFSKNCR